MTGAAGFWIVRRPLDHAFMGFGLSGCVAVTLVAERTSVLEVGVGFNNFLIDNIPHVVIRPDRGRRTRSPLSFFGINHRRWNEGFHYVGIAVTVEAA